jgi:ACT domain-containing protein
MSKQRTALEYSEAHKRFRAVMEQNTVHFEVQDIPKALDCLLDVLGGRNLDVLETVQDMLIARACSRFSTQAKAALLLGISPRKLSYDVVQRQVLKINDLIAQFEQMPPKQIEE